MSGLDGLIGAEERIINSKPKISDNVVRPLCRFVTEHFGVTQHAERTFVKA